MAEYIDRAQAIDAIRKYSELLWEAHHEPVPLGFEYTIADLPIIRDVREVKHGRWVYCGLDDMDDGLYKCTACQGEIFFAEGCDPNEFYGFCPCCGADMRGDKE